MDQLYRTHFPMLHTLANSILQDDSLAGDAVTDGMMSLFSKVDTLRSLEKLELLGYLRRTVRNAAFKQYNARKCKNFTEILMGPDLLFSLPEPDELGPDRITLKNEEFRLVHTAVAAIPLEERQLLYLKYALQLTAREIGEITDAPSENAVQTRIWRARKKVLRALEDQGWTTDE